MTGRVPYRDIPGRNGNLLRLGVTVPADAVVRLAVHPTTTNGEPMHRVPVVELDAAATFALITDLLARVQLLTAPLDPHELPEAQPWTGAGRR